MYIKATLSYKLLNDIQLIINYFKQNELNKFIEQTNPEANLGCHDYHITIIGNINSCFNSFEEAVNFIYKWQKDIDIVTIIPTNIIKITSTGKVLWLLESNELQYLGADIYNEILKYSNKVVNYCNKEYIHITLGITTEQSFFNNQYILNNEIFDKIDKKQYIDYFGIA